MANITDVLMNRSSVKSRQNDISEFYNNNNLMYY